ncbi:MAG: AEC family transporter [Verrucomicrobiaceae bacterium]|nr:MAG: AEC family transporter [Verrucomicrobiaceae bacterium]
MLVHVISTLFPVFSVLLLGFILVRTGFMSSAFVEDMNNLIYWVGLPAFIIGRLGRATGVPDAVLPLVSVFAISTVVFVIVCWLGLLLLRFPVQGRGTFLQAVYRSNLAFVGIPILIYALRGLPQEEIDSVTRQAVFLFAPTMVLYNLIAAVVFPLPVDAAAGSFPRLRSTVKGFGRNPLLIASVAGVVLVLVPWKLPDAVLDSFDYLGTFAAPAAVLGVGGAMATTPLGSQWRAPLAAALLKIAGLPLLTALVAMPFDLGRRELLILLVFSTAPCAAGGYVIARKMGGDGRLAASSIFISTVLSVISLSAVIAWFIG